MRLAKHIYSLSDGLPKNEIYGLTGQLRRAAVSIPANIAEGYGRNNRKEYLQFLGVSSGSNCELLTLLLLAKDVYPRLDVQEAIELTNRVGQMLTRLKQSLRA